ncbi:MAG: MMPL family transporter, partial [Actinomycetia bacterium]|nr:MMPL family transporter [Actinomycetes bacterium]
MKFGSQLLARTSALHPWRTVGVWVFLVITAGILSSQLLGSALTTSVRFTDSPESTRAAALIEEVRGGSADTEFVIISSDELTARDPAFVAYVSLVQDTVASLDDNVVVGVGSYLTSDGPVSESGHTVLLPVVLSGEGSDVTSGNAERLGEAIDAISQPVGFETLVAGPQTVSNDVNKVAEEDLATGEMIGIAVALVVLIIVFGTVVSGVIPIVLGVVSIAVSMGLAAVLGQVFELNFFITNMITMIGLAVGIDYSLFIVSRYREERAAGLDKFDAIVRSGGTA